MRPRSEGVECDTEPSITFPSSGIFKLGDRELVQSFIDRFPPLSCEFNFTNLFCWQEVYKYSWFSHRGRLIIYDGVNNCMFMPLGEDFPVDELLSLSHHLVGMGHEPSIGIVPGDYIETHPDIERFYTIQEERDHAEYIYRVDSLVELNGIKLHKKRNLIAQFNRRNPDCSARPLKGDDLKLSCDFARNLLDARKKKSKDLEDEFSAIEKAFENFECLGFEGMGLWVKERMVAFCVFSRLTHDTYNIQFEKSDTAFKGAAQVINQETAKYLQDKCVYINREQDLGIKGLRQAKLSYEPERLFIPHVLKLKTRG
ncbi:MAG: DUF2156 domain-containing protein [Proteobacteria bacterium]|nr:DUF2156 domain-containing protein [Desulfobacula sp.]MBU4129324.1 DUF2156 domain-containing protein [Pseudomonadota bacterium]